MATFNVRGRTHILPRTQLLAEPTSVFARALDGGVPMAIDSQRRVLVDVPPKRWGQLCDWLRCGAVARTHDPELAAEAHYWGFERLHAALQGVEVGLLNVRGRRMELPRDLASTRDPQSRLADMLGLENDLPRDAHGVPYLNVPLAHLETLLDWYGCGVVPERVDDALMTTLGALRAESLKRELFAVTHRRLLVEDSDVIYVMTVPHLSRQLDAGATVTHEFDYLNRPLWIEFNAQTLRLTGAPQDLTSVKLSGMCLAISPAHKKLRESYDLEKSYDLDAGELPHTFKWAAGEIDLLELCRNHHLFSSRPDAVDLGVALVGRDEE